MKRFLAFVLTLTLSFGILTACGEKTPAPTQAPTQAPTPDDGILQVLIIGHSLGEDSVWLLPAVAKNEGYPNMEVGALYYSGCRLHEHVEFGTGGDLVYEYRQFDVAKDTTWQVAKTDGTYRAGGTGEGRNPDGLMQTMEFAIEAQDWDLVVLQAGVFEAGGKETTDGKLDKANIQDIMDLVNKHDIDPTTKPEFAWNVTWTNPEKEENRSKAYNGHLLSAYTSSQELYESICTTAKDVIVPAYDFACVFPSGTAFQNAHSSYLNDDVYRDYIHASDYTRLVVAYTWFCTLTDQTMADMKFGEIPYRHLFDTHARMTKQNLVLTDLEKNLLIESVTNALEKPYEMTQSQYTEAPNETPAK